MNPLLIAQLIQMAAFVPEAINIVRETLAAVEKLKESGTPTQEQLDALAAQIVANHGLLPPPE